MQRELLEPPAIADQEQPLWSCAQVVETDPFREWFRQSLVVDSTGLPRVVFHATQVWENPERGTRLGVFDIFDRKHTEKVFGETERMDQVGSWFSTNSGERGAGMYASKGIVYPVYLSIQSPRVYYSFSDFLQEGQEASGWKSRVRRRTKNSETGKVRTWWDNVPEGRFNVEPLRQKLIAEGFDGLWFPKSTKIDGGDHEVWVAFESEQIKSAIGNCGAFSRFDPSIVR